jgi:hypothetical protein
VALGAVLAGFVVLALLVAVLTPPWEAVDEPAHVQNVETLAGGHLYRITKGSGVEPHQPPLYYGLLAGWQRLLGTKPFAVHPAIGCNFFAGRCLQLFRHDTPTEGRDRRRLILLRVPGVLLGALAIFFTAAAARQLSRNPWTPVVAAAVVAFTPRLIFLSGVVTNDNLANALAAGATALAMAALTRHGGPSRDRILVAAGLGVMLGALFLAKETTLALAPGLALAAYLSGVARRDGLRLVAIAAAAAAVVSAPWLIHNTAAYGDPLALRATHDYLMQDQTALIFAAGPAPKVLFVTMPQQFYSTFWYQSGWAPFEWPWWASLPFWLLTLAGLAGLVARRRPRTARPNAPAPEAPPTAYAPARRALATLALLAVMPVVLVWMLRLDTTTASPRLALIGMPALACLIAVGLERLRVPLAARFALPLLGVVGTLIAIDRDVLAVRGKTHPTAAAAVAPRHPVGARSGCELKRNAADVCVAPPARSRQARP